MDLEIKQAVSSLLRNISNGLKYLSVEELNKAITEILVKKKEKKADLEVLYSVVSKEFSITRKAFLEKYSRGNLYNAKITMYVIMNNHLGLSKRAIAKHFSVLPNSINTGIQIFDKLNPEKFKEDAIFQKKYHKCLSNFLQKIS
jgi:hypothetical protein